MSSIKRSTPKFRLYRPQDPEIEKMLAVIAELQQKSHRAIIRDMYCELFCLPKNRRLGATDRNITKAVDSRAELTGKPFTEVINELLTKYFKININ